MPTILVGRCEIWGYSEILEGVAFNAFLGPLVLALFWSPFLFPVVVGILQHEDESPERWTWAALPLSLALSLVQLLALLPLVQ
ncbi:MAG: hypothetical protein ACP5XB_29895 [Isosphaeraceae bacterium]